MIDWLINFLIKFCYRKLSFCGTTGSENSEVDPFINVFGKFCYEYSRPCLVWGGIVTCGMYCITKHLQEYLHLFYTYIETDCSY